MGKNIDWDKVETIVDEVLELPEEDWFNFVEEQCKASQEVKSEVTRLLQSIADSQGWLENAKTYKRDLIDSAPASTASSLVGTELGSYHISEVIAQGGMGVVYRGERADGEFDHTVAIKVIKVGMDTPENIRLFNRERNILAGLNHPGIAKLFDGGVLQDDTPYLIMEYVEGTPIDKYCDENKLRIHERIDLFKKVLEAVRHAHENLTIHRDLKPDNILITTEGEVKILDFGIAKLLDTNIDGDENLTITRTRILTPKYAAPEQIRQEPVTTATDMYSLGIILYQLLTGYHPYDLQKKSVYEIGQIILNSDPALPSNRVSQSEDSDTVAEKRLEITASIVKKLKGDLDAILLKAIAKDSHQRYRAGREFIDELENYQSDLPVSARKRTLGYRFKKYLGRNRVALSIASLFIFLTVSFLFFHTTQINKERDQAEFQAQKATTIQEFLVDIFRYNNPNAELYAGKDLTAGELLQTGVKQAEEELQHQSEAQIGIMVAISEALKNLDELEEAEQTIQTALEKSEQHYGPNDLQTARIYNTFANIKSSAGEYEKSNELLQQAIEINKTSTDTAVKQLADTYSILAFNKALQSQYNEAEELFNYTDSLFVASKQSNSLERHNTLSNFAEVKLKLGKEEEALEYNEKALDHYRELYEGEHLNIATTLNKIGKVHKELGDHKQADEYYQQSLEMKLRLLDEDNSSVADTYRQLAINSLIMGNYKEAKEYALKELNIMENIYDEDHIRIVPTLNIRGMVSMDLEEYEEAEQIFKRIIAIQEDHYEKEVPNLAVTLYNLANLYQKTERYEEAYPIFERVVDIDKKNLGPEHAEVAIDLNKLGDVSREMGTYSRADSIFTEAESIFKDKFPDEHYRVAEHLVSYGQLKLKQKAFDEAAEDFEKAAEIFEENFGEDDSRVEEALSYLEKANKGA